VIGIVLTAIAIVVLFGIRVSINDAIRTARYRRRHEQRVKIPKEWRSEYGRKHF
jgi:hypothetical protein